MCRVIASTQMRSAKVTLSHLVLLNRKPAQRRRQPGWASGQGRGAGADPEIGQRAAEEGKDEISNALKGTQMVFITAGLAKCWRTAQGLRLLLRKPCRSAQPDRLILVASGTSRNAAAAAAPFMEWALDLPVDVTAPSGLGRIVGKRPFLIFVSQGGNSTNTIAAIERTGPVSFAGFDRRPPRGISTPCAPTRC